MSNNGLNNHLWIVRRLQVKYEELVARHISPREAVEDLYLTTRAILREAEQSIERGGWQHYESPAMVSAGMSRKIECLVELSILDCFSVHISSFDDYYNNTPTVGEDSSVWIAEPSTLDSYILEKTGLSSVEQLALGGHRLAELMDVDRVHRYIVPEFQTKLSVLYSELSELDCYIGQLEGVEEGEPFREELQARRLEKSKARLAVRFAEISLKRAHCQCQVTQLLQLAMDYPLELIGQIREIRATIDSYRSLHETSRAKCERGAMSMENACSGEYDTHSHMIGKAFKAHEDRRCLIVIDDAVARLDGRIAELEMEQQQSSAAAADPSMS